MPRSTVLAVGGPGDWSLAEVGKALEARGVQWMLLNTADFPRHITVNVEFAPSRDEWDGEFVTPDGRVRLSDVIAVYYCKPLDFEFPPMSGPELRFARAQARVGLGGVLASMPVRWVSHPSALADATYKPWQLARLRQAGLTVPPTLVTNDPAGVRAFAAQYGHLVVKPLAEPVVWEGGGESVLYTRPLAPKDLDNLAGVEVTAHLFQQWQDKAFEVRLTAVGAHLFAVAIHAESESAYIDWRTDYDSHRYAVIEVPDRVRSGVARYLAAARLEYSAFDFVVQPDGEWVVLEANCVGVWDWLADKCELPIADAFADLLTKEPTP